MNDKEYKGFSRWLQYVLARAMIGVLMAVPIGLAWRLGRALGWLLWALLTARRRIVRKNLRIIAKWAKQNGREDLFEGLPIDRQVREVFLRTGANLICGYSLAGMTPEKLERHVEFRGGDALRRAVEGGRGVVLLLCHMGPWEALAHLPEMFQAQRVHSPLGAMYRRFNNDYMDEWYKGLRERRGTRMFSSRHRFYAPVEFVRQGGILGILSDQRASGGEPVEYFGRLTHGTPLPGLIHLRSKSAWFALSLSTVGHTQWRITIHEVAEDEQERSREALAQTVANSVEQCLETSMLDGFWLNNRFKGSRDVDAPRKIRSGRRRRGWRRRTGEEPQHQEEGES